MTNPDYTFNDHLFRGADQYALTKYDITADWLRESVRPGMTLINVGCGAGEFNHQAVAMGLRVVAAEPDPGAYEVAVKTKPAHNCEILPEGLFALGEQDFDFLVMHDVLEHIENEKLAVHAMAGLLKRKGRAIVSVPALSWLFGHHDVQLGHYRRYSRGTLLPLFVETFDVRRARYFGLSFIPVTLLFSRILKRPYPMQAAGSKGWAHGLVRGLCSIERRISPPLGTSVLVEIEKR